MVGKGRRGTREWKREHGLRAAGSCAPSAPDSALGVRGAPCALHAAPLPPGLAAVRTVHRLLSAEAFLFIHSVTFLRMSYMPGTLKSGGCRSGHNRPVPPNPVAGGPSTPFSVLTLQGSTRAFSLCSGPPALTPQLCPFAEDAGILSACLSSLHSRYPQVMPLPGCISISVTQQVEAEHCPLK